MELPKFNSVLQPTGTEFRVMLVSKISRVLKNTSASVEDVTILGLIKSTVKNYLVELSESKDKKIRTMKGDRRFLMWPKEQRHLLLKTQSDGIGSFWKSRGSGIIAALSIDI